MIINHATKLQHALSLTHDGDEDDYYDGDSVNEVSIVYEEINEKTSDFCFRLKGGLLLKSIKASFFIL